MSATASRGGLERLRDLHIAHQDFLLGRAVEKGTPHGPRAAASRLAYDDGQETWSWAGLARARLTSSHRHHTSVRARTSCSRATSAASPPPDVALRAYVQAAGHLFSLIASARLHRLDPEAYLRDLFRVLANWPRDRYLELAPK